MRPPHGLNAAPPKARDEGLLIERVGDETVVYDLENKNAHCLAPLAAVVFDLSDGERSAAKIAGIAGERLGTPVSEDDVVGAVGQLGDCSLLVDTPVLDSPVLVRDGHTRRQAIGKVAFAGAAAAFGGSLITSIAAPSALAAGNGLPVGCACTKNKNCASNHCCGDTGGGTAGRCNSGCCADDNGQECICQGNGICPSVATPPATCTACIPTSGPCPT